MSYREEFPDFDLGVTIPPGFEDVSSGRDHCPSWVNKNLGLRLWIEDYDPQYRTMGPRFLLEEIDYEGWQVSDEPEDKLATDEWEEIIEVIEAMDHRDLSLLEAMDMVL